MQQFNQRDKHEMRVTEVDINNRKITLAREGESRYLLHNIYTVITYDYHLVISSFKIEEVLISSNCLIRSISIILSEITSRVHNSVTSMFTLIY